MAIGKFKSWFIGGPLICLLTQPSMVFSECDKSFSIGWETWKPYLFEMHDQNKLKLTGMDVEIAATVLQKLGCSYEFVNMPWSKNLQKVETGTVDMALSASKLPDRERYAYFSDSYRQEEIHLFTQKDTPQKFKIDKLEDIIHTSFRLGVVEGYEYGPLYEKLAKLPDFQNRLIPVKIPHENLENLILNKIDGFLDDPISINTYLKEGFEYDKTKLDLIQYPFLITRNPIYVMFSKMSVQKKYVEAFNTELQKLKQEQYIDQIIRSYLNPGA